MGHSPWKYVTYTPPGTASNITINPPNMGDRYTSYVPVKGGTLTIVNLKQFSAWLQGAVLREKLKEIQHDQ